MPGDSSFATEERYGNLCDVRRRAQGLVGWLLVAVPIPIGYANQGINEAHYHAVMHEVYLIARGSSTALVGGQEVRLAAGDILVVEPGEVHTFLESSAEYLHFVLQIPFTLGDKHLPEASDSGAPD